MRMSSTEGVQHEVDSNCLSHAADVNSRHARQHLSADKSLSMSGLAIFCMDGCLLYFVLLDGPAKQ